MDTFFLSFCISLIFSEEGRACGHLCMWKRGTYFSSLSPVLVLGDARLSGRSCIWKEDIFVHSVSLVFVSWQTRRHTPMSRLYRAGRDRSAGLYRRENSFICLNVCYEAPFQAPPLFISRVDLRLFKNVRTAKSTPPHFPPHHYEALDAKRRRHLASFLLKINRFRGKPILAIISYSEDRGTNFRDTYSQIARKVESKISKRKWNTKEEHFVISRDKIWPFITLVVMYLATNTLV